MLTILIFINCNESDDNDMSDGDLDQETLEATEEELSEDEMENSDLTEDEEEIDALASLRWMDGIWVVEEGPFRTGEQFEMQMNSDCMPWLDITLYGDYFACIQLGLTFPILVSETEDPDKWKLYMGYDWVWDYTANGIIDKTLQKITVDELVFTDIRTREQEERKWIFTKK